MENQYWGNGYLDHKEKPLENFRHEVMREKGTCERRDTEFISLVLHLHHYQTASGNKMFENAFR